MNGGINFGSLAWALAMAASTFALADEKPVDKNASEEQAASQIGSGPMPGAELEIFKARRVTNATCVHCAMT